MVYFSIVYIKKTFKLINRIKLGFIKKNNLIEVFIDLEKSDDFKDNNLHTNLVLVLILRKVMVLNSISQIKKDINNNNTLNKLCVLYIKSKLI